MLLVVFAQVIEDRGRALGRVLVAWILRVEDAERVRLEPALRLFAERALLRLEERLERVAVARARLGAADRVDEHLEIDDAERAEERHEHLDHLGVAAGAGVAEDLGAGLRELTIAAALRALGAEHRAEVVPARDRLEVLDLVLDVRARRARRALGADREVLVVVTERVHLLLDDVRAFADRAHEEARRLDDRRPHLAEAVEREGSPEGRLDPLPLRGLLRENVVHPFDGADRIHGRPWQLDGQRRDSKLLVLNTPA